MKPALLWDAGPGEMRAGLIEHGQLAELRIIRQRRDQALYAAGEHYTARITGRLGPGKALVTLGGTCDAMLQGAGKLAEGSLLTVEMTRAAVPEPGRWKLPVVRPAPGIAPQSEPGWHFSDEPWVLFLRRLAPSLGEIVCPSAAAANELRGDLGGPAPPIRIDPQAIAEADLEGHIEAAVRGEFPIENGTISIERTRAMTMIDVDGGGDPLALNLAAARAIPHLLRLYDIGGPVGIDFLTLQERAARHRVDAALAEASVELGPHERTAINGFGFAQIVRARRGPSIPELICGITPGRLSLESRAIALLREAGRSTGHGPRRLVAPPAIVELIRQWPEETGALRFALGVEIELVADPAATGYGHVHVSQS
jgi:ribonuclease G